MSSWYSVADKLENTQCFERKRTGSCSHNTNGKGCGKTQMMIEACNDKFKNGTTPDEVIKHLATKRCRNKCCIHKGCSEVDRLVKWANRLPVAA